MPDPIRGDSPEGDLRSFAQWLIAMDEPGSSQRQTVTLTQIIEAAKVAFTQPTTEPPTDSSQDSPAKQQTERETARPITPQVPTESFEATSSDPIAAFPELARKRILELETVAGAFFNAEVEFRNLMFTDAKMHGSAGEREAEIAAEQYERKYSDYEVRKKIHEDFWGSRDRLRKVLSQPAQFVPRGH